VANITITAANVIAGSVGDVYVAGEVISAGQWVYVKAADGRAWLSDNTTAAKAAAVGISLNRAAAAGQPVCVLRSGVVAIGSVLTEKGNQYAISGTAGVMMDVADLAAGKFVTTVGYSESETELSVVTMATGLAYS